MRRYINTVVIIEIHTMKKQKEIEFLESLRPARFLKNYFKFCQNKYKRQRFRHHDEYYAYIKKSKKYKFGCLSGQLLAASFINSAIFSESVTGCGHDDRCYI
jgi:hypothetical protein